MVFLYWQDIVATSSVLSIFLVAWWVLDRRLTPLSTLMGKISFGALLGVTAVLGMIMAAEVLPGFKFDLRHAFIAASGLFGGPASALITSAAAAVFRVYLGGAGALPGLFGILISASIGSIGYYIMPSGRRSILMVSIFAGCVSLGVLASFVAIDVDVRNSLLRTIGVPLLALTFVSTIITVLLLNLDLIRREAFRLNEIYAAMVKELPDCLNAKDLNGHFIAANDATARLMRAMDANELIGRSDFDYYPKDLANEYRQDEMAVMKSGEPHLIEQRVTFHTGEKGWLSTYKVPLRAPDGQIIGIITHNRDITEHRALKDNADRSCDRTEQRAS